MLTDSVSHRLEELHRQAQDCITWLSIPGAAQSAGIYEPNFFIASFKLLLNSCTPNDTDAIDDLEALLRFVKGPVLR